MCGCFPKIILLRHFYPQYCVRKTDFEEIVEQYQNMLEALEHLSWEKKIPSPPPPLLSSLLGEETFTYLLKRSMPAFSSLKMHALTVSDFIG